MSLIDEGIQSGLDLMFDTYSYHCGFSVINVLYPEWFLARVPEVYSDTWALFRLRAELELIVALLGFGYENVQVLNTKHPALKKYNGMFLKDIADARGLSQFENFLDVTEKSEGRAVVLNHRYSSQENIKIQIFLWVLFLVVPLFVVAFWFKSIMYGVRFQKLVNHYM